MGLHKLCSPILSFSSKLFPVVNALCALPTELRRNIEEPRQWTQFPLCRHLPIFPGRHQPSIFGTTELNFRVRDGNGWTLSVIDTNYLIYPSHGFSPCYYLFGDPWGNRTPVTGVRGRCLNRLTNGPYLARGTGLPAFFWYTIRGSTPGLKICH